MGTHSGWAAQLALKVGVSQAGSIPTLRSHFGPLRLQKVLYPEGPEVLHAIVVHPPGGVVGGDQLNIQVEVEPNASCLITTPGAAKWYRTEQHASKQQIELVVGAGARLEWLPQENIIFDGAQTQWRTDVMCAASARAIGIEVVMLGRAARGERFASGQLSNEFNLYEPQQTSQQISQQTGGELKQLIFAERWNLQGNDARLNNQQGLNGLPCFGQLWAFGEATNMQLALQAVQQLLEQEARSEPFKSGTLNGAVTVIRQKLLMVRMQGAGPELVRSILEKVWQQIRLPIMNKACITPRIWST